LSESYDQALGMTNRTENRTASQAEVLTFQVRRSDLNSLNQKFFVVDNEFRSSTRFHRTPGTPLHSHDVITGPVINNLSTFSSTPFPLWNQTSFHTQEAIDLLRIKN